MAGKDNVIEMIFRSVNETGAGVQQIIREQQQVGQAAAQSANAQRASIAQVTPELDRLRSMLTKLGEQYTNSGTIGRNSITALSVAVKDLERQHGGAEQAAKRLAGAERQIYDSAKASIQDALSKQREFNEEQKKVGRATHEWSSLEGSIQSLGGKFGTVAIAVGGVFAAFSEGWRIGKQFDKFLEENVETWRKWKLVSTDALRGTAADLANNLELAQRTRDLLPEIIARIAKARLGREGAISPAEGLKAMEEVQKEIGRGQQERDEALKKSAGEAAAAAKKYREEVLALAGVGADAAKEQRQLAEAIAIIDAQTGKSGAGADHFAERLKKISDEAAATGGTIDSRLIPALQRLYDLQAHPQIGAEFSAIGRALAQQASPVINQSGFDAELKKMADARLAAEKKAGEEFKRSAEEAGRIFTERFQQPMTDLFTSLALEGGKGFGRAAGQIFAQSVHDGAGAFVRLIGQGLSQLFGGGAITKDAGGTFSFGGQSGLTQEQATALQAQRQARVGQIAGTAVGAAAEFARVTSQSGGQRQSALSTVASFTAAGASVGGLYGAIAGAIVGGVAALLAPPQGADYSYGRPGVRGGRAFFDYSSSGGRGGTGQLQNISTNAAKTALASIQQMYDTVVGEFTRTLLKIPVQFLPAAFSSIQAVLPQIGKDAGGDIGRAASANFWKDFELWFRQGLPRDLGEHFRPVFEQAFVGMGFTVDRFGEIWQALGELDPAAARQALDQLTTAVVGMREAFAYLERDSGGRGGLIQLGQEANRQSTAQQLSEQADEIYRLADVMGDLPISQQIAAAAEINRLTQQRVEIEKQFFEELAAAIQNVTESFASSIRDLDLAGIRTASGAPDYQGQAEYLKKYLDTLRGRLASATSPQEAQSIGEEIRSVISQIYGLGQQLGPAAGEEFREWALDAMTEGRDAVLDRLKALGDEVAAENREFMDRVQKDWAEFTTVAHDFSAALGDATGAINGFIDGLLHPPTGPGGSGGGDRGIRVPIDQPIEGPPDTGFITPPITGPPLFGPGSGPPSDGGFQGLSMMIDRLDRVERAIQLLNTGSSQGMQTLAGLQAQTVSAIKEAEFGGDTVVLPVPVPSGGGSPASRRGRQV